MHRLRLGNAGSLEVDPGGSALEQTVQPFPLRNAFTRLPATVLLKRLHRHHRQSEPTLRAQYIEHSSMKSPCRRVVPNILNKCGLF
jgi:hypothetical protein